MLSFSANSGTTPSNLSHLSLQVLGCFLISWGTEIHAVLDSKLLTKPGTFSNAVICCRGLGTNTSTTSRSCIKWGWVISLLFLTKWAQKGKTSFATVWKVTQRWGGRPASSLIILLSRFVSQLWPQSVDGNSFELASLFAAMLQGFVSQGEAGINLRLSRKPGVESTCASKHLNKGTWCAPCNKLSLLFWDALSLC